MEKEGGGRGGVSARQEAQSHQREDKCITIDVQVSFSKCNVQLLFFILKASNFPTKMLRLTGWDWVLPPPADLVQTSQYVHPFYGKTCREPSKRHKRQQGNIRLKIMFSQSKSQSTDGINARFSFGGGVGGVVGVFHVAETGPVPDCKILNVFFCTHRHP